ncbi:MAG: trypsin-like peptidase domain-containing protein [Pseudonocardiaceae bacterium]
MSEAISRARVAELIVTHAWGRHRGSGYLVTAEAVLTAAHVVEGALSVEVRFAPDLPGEWSTVAVSWWADSDVDLAVVSISPQPGDQSVSQVRFGRIGDRAAVLAVQAVGFPRWKMRTYDGTIPVTGDGRLRYRDAHHAVGSVAVLSNWREGTLEVVVAPACAADPAVEASPWEGMSGAALWVGDRIVGVVSKHHPGDGLARLAATRIDIALDRLDAAQKSALRALLPLLPEHSEQLPDVLPAPHRQLVTTAYHAQLSDIAPEQLLGREAELDELVTFCAGKQPYAWWQAGPWAGKSALLSWFVLHPPDGVDVVSFFVTSRLAGQSDSDAFTDALIEQLAALTNESPQVVREARARGVHTLRLLQDASRRCAEVGRRLVLVVDGLDEDTSTTTGIDRPSIAALLPRRPPPEVRVLVASRPHPELPSDVPGDHPLRTIAPWPLAVSPYARDLERVARNELARLLRGSPFQRDVLGLITASGGGLTHGDLEELTGRPPYELDDLFGGVFGRSIGARASPTPAVGRAAERVYLFAHETLRETAKQQYGSSLASYRNQLHTWAKDYQARGWPFDTPMYLLRGYTRLLATTGDIFQLLAYATDRTRQDRMLDLTGGDTLALTEIATTASLITQQPDPNLGALLRLALTRDELAERNANIPADLPAVWIILGQPARAAALANGIANPARRAQALSRLIGAVAAAGDHERAMDLATDAETTTCEIIDPRMRARVLSELASAVAATGDHERATTLATNAETTIRKISDPDIRAWLLSELVGAVAAAGDHERAMDLATEAETVTREITDPHAQAQALSELASAVAATGDHERATTLATNAETTIREIIDPQTRTRVLSELVAAVAAAGDHNRAARLTRQITSPATRARVFRELVGAVSVAGDHGWAMTLATDAETATREITDPYAQQALVLRELVVTVAAAGDHDRAARLARDITNPNTRAQALSELAATVAAAGDHKRAMALATDAEAATREINSSYARGQVLSELVGAVAAAGDHERAMALATDVEATIREVMDRRRRTRMLSDLVARVATPGNQDRAARFARGITNPAIRAQVLSELIEAAAVVGDHGWAIALANDGETAIRQITDPDIRAWLLSELVGAIAGAGDHERALALATDAETATREITSSDARGQVLIELVRAVAAAGDHERALALATDAETTIREIIDHRTRIWMLSELVKAVAAAGDHERALALATNAETTIREIIDPRMRTRMLSELVGAVAAAGGHERAVRIAREIPDPETRARALSDVVLRIIRSRGRNVPDQEAAVSSLKSFLAEAINTSSWLLALPAVARLDPSALSATCDVLLARTNPS